MPETTETSIKAFEWRFLPEFSDLLSRLGSHGFREWPSTADELRSQLEVLRADLEQDAVLLWSESRLCGYALTLHERDIDRTVATLAVVPECELQAGQLLDWVIERSRNEGVSLIHVALRGTPVEPKAILVEKGFREVTASLDLALNRAHASGITDSPLPGGFTIRPMRSSVETLLLTRMQNTIFSKHWGFSQNTPEEIQARLDLPSSGPEHVQFAEAPDGTVAGYVWTALEWQDQQTKGQIWMTGVMPEFRRSGIGRSIVKAGIKHLFAQGAAEVHLEVIEHNAGAVRIYTEMGFSETRRVSWYELGL